MVFVLQHSYELEDGVDEIKFIGVYSSEIEAKNAIIRLQNRPGFDKYPSGFCIDEYKMDKDNWSDGFFTP